MKRLNIRNRKAQITVFMVLGIILLFSTALIFYIKGRIPVPEGEVLPALQDTPDVLKPVRSFVEGCAAQTMEVGLDRAMEHGGLIYTDELTVDIVEPTEGEGVEYVPDSLYKVPYWSYMKSKNDCTEGCTLSTKMPTLCKSGRIGCITSGDGSIEEELQRYLEEEMKGCIRDFKQLQNQGYTITELSNITANVNIRERDAVALIEYELSVEKEGRETEIKEYYAAVPTKITEMYDISLQIVNYTTTYCLYERYTMDLISSYTGLEKNSLPPTAEITFGLKDKKWSFFRTKEKLDNIVNNMVSFLKVSNTTNDILPEIEETGEYKRTRQGVFDRTLYYPLKEYKDVEIHTKKFPWWNAYLKMSPTEGDKLGPTSTIDSADDDIIGELMELLSYREYYYDYQYSYPIVTDIVFEDEKGEKKVFRYAQEVNLRNRACMRPSTRMLSSPATRRQTILCDQDMREEQNTTIRVYDEFNRTKKLEEVKIYFDAIEKCFLGETETDGIVVANMPQADGYFLTFEKKGYLKKYIHQTDITKPIKVYLTPITKKKVSVKTINKSVVDKIRAASTTMEAFAWVRNSSQDLLDTDKLIISIERIPQTYQDQSFKKQVIYDNQRFNPTEIDITTGKYAVTITMMDRRNHTLVRELDRECEEDSDADGSCVKTPVDPNCKPRGDSEEDWKEGDCYIQGYTCESAEDARDKGAESEDDDYEACVWCFFTLFGCDECYSKECIDEEGVDEDILYPEENITNIPIGGIVLDNETRYYLISDSDKITNNDEIVFYVFKQPVPIRHHHVNEINQYRDWSAAYANYVMPRLK